MTAKEAEKIYYQKIDLIRKVAAISTFQIYKLNKNYYDEIIDVVTTSFFKACKNYEKGRGAKLTTYFIYIAKNDVHSYVNQNIFFVSEKRAEPLFIEDKAEISPAIETFYEIEEKSDIELYLIKLQESEYRYLRIGATALLMQAYGYGSMSDYARDNDIPIGTLGNYLAKTKEYIKAHYRN